METKIRKGYMKHVGTNIHPSNNLMLIKLLLCLMVFFILGCTEKKSKVATKPDYRLDYVTIYDEAGIAHVKVSEEMRSKLPKEVIHELNLIGDRELNINAKHKGVESIPSMAGSTIIGLELINLEKNGKRSTEHLLHFCHSYQSYGIYATRLSMV